VLIFLFSETSKPALGPNRPTTLPGDVIDVK
jgi:hypothetical protein